MLSGPATATTTAIVGPPAIAEIGISAVRRARPTSATTIIRLRSLRSARAPANRPKAKSVSAWIARTTPIATPDPVSSRTSSGSAVTPTRSPIDEIPWLTASSRKSRFWDSGWVFGSAATASRSDIGPPS